MQYNILPGALWEINTTSGIGNKSVDFNKICSLASFGDIPVVTLSGVDKFVVDFDFGHRVHLDRFEYKFISDNATPAAVSSGIKFYSKDESFETYVSLGTLFNDNIFYTIGSGSIFAPRYIRTIHTLSDTYGVPTASGSAYGFRALNNDTIVDFGIDGYQTMDSMETARGSAPIIKTIPIYNNSLIKTDAFVNLEPTFSPIDDVMYISDNVDGPWIKALDPSELVADNTNFNYGYYGTYLHFVNGPLRITGMNDLNGKYFSMLSNAYYLTRILKKNSTYCRFIIDNAGIGGRICTDREDATETIEIRSSSMKPVPYVVFRELRNIPVSNSSPLLGYRDRWLSTQAIKEDSSWTFSLSCSSYSMWKDYKVVYDQTTERWAGYVTHTNNNSYSTAELYLFNNVGTAPSNTYRLSYQSTSGIPMSFFFRELKLEITGGMWVYFYCQAYHSGDFVHATGFFLAYFDVNFNNTFKWFTLTEEIGKMDIDYNGRYVWYTRPSMNAIYKLDISGDIQVNFVDEDVNYNLGGIAVMPDGNLMYANGKDLHRLKYNGIYLPEYFIEGVVETRIDYIVLDGDGSETIWTIEGMTIGLLYIVGERKGTYDFRVTVDYPTKMVPVLGGVWVTCSDMGGSGGIVMRFISKENRRVDTEYRPSYTSSPGLLCQTYEHPNYVSKMPVNIDTIWSTLPWKKVALNGFLSSEDQYYQLKISLRNQEPVERYPEFVTDQNQTFSFDNSFDQNVAMPKQLMWGDWLNYPYTDRVYVDTSIKKLILVPNSNFTTQHSYINTSNRIIVSRNSGGILDIRLHYTLGAGDGVESGKVENVYIYIYSVESGYEGKYAGLRLYIPTTTTSTNTRIYSRVNDSGAWNYTNYGWTGTGSYDGNLNLYWDGTNFYARWGEVSGTYTIPHNTACTSTNIGNYFYIHIESDELGSQLKIDDLYVYAGNIYYYTESPLINSIHKQELLEIKDIYPNNHKNVYVKTYVPKDLDIGSSYDMDMKVRWRVPIY